MADAQAPAGRPGLVASVADIFQLHASPEAFLASRMAEHHRHQPDGAKSPAVVKARILNREVAIVTSYRQALQVLQPQENRQTEVAYEASGAYSPILEPFFPTPNLLLADACPHAAMRRRWEPVTYNLAASRSTFRQIARQWFSELPLATEIQLYRTMKYLSWRLILGPTLGVSPGGSDAREIERLQEDVLRGQFSTFPLSVNAGVWQSARSKGIEARQKLQRIFNQRLDKHKPDWIPQDMTRLHRQEVVNHLIITTSSLAVKSLASLLTALFLNFYVYQDTTGKSLDRDRLESLFDETARLSPPIVGVMRRCTRENILQGTDETASVQMQQGWDAWVYIAGANRDSATFGATADEFHPERYNDGAQVAPAVTLGAGNKECLGRDMIKSCCIATLEACQALDIQMTSNPVKQGVQAWLGWAPAAAEDWARDMKQLPTQRPAAPVLVQFTRGFSEQRQSYDR